MSDFTSNVVASPEPVSPVESAPSQASTTPLALVPDAPAAGVPADASFVGSARAVIRQLVLAGDASVRNVAKALNTSGRTLQRRLQHEGTSLQQLISAVRCELAMEMLRSPGQSSNEISDQLGFSAPSAFHRAFKRWTGMTPGQYRRAEWRAPGPV
jgi:AraC-like DNA-binding protein